MASAFVNASFANLKGSEGPCQLVGYLCRTRFIRKRTRRIVDFIGIAEDLVYHRVRLPEGAPDDFHDPGTLANAAEAAERDRMRKTRARKRWPQFAALLIGALPPDTEATLDEAIELAESLVDRIIGGRRLAAVIAIHDPAVTTPGATNRHVHVVVFLREVDRNGFGRKVRDLVARARRGATGKNYVAEAVHWPRLSFNLQQQFLFELATDTIVAPSAPCPGRRLPLATMREPEVVAAYRREVRNQNIEIIYGPAALLVDQMLHGRSTMPVEELRQLLARFIDNEAERREHLTEILADPAIVTFGAHPGELRPSRLTTRAVYETMMHATQKLDRAAGNRRATDDPTAAPRISVVAGPTAATVNRAIVARVDVDAPLLVGTLSDCALPQEELAPRRPAFISVAALLHSTDGGARGAIPHAGLIVVPCSHTLTDQALAAIIAAAEDQGARLLLGYDESAGAGIAAHRLAAYAADALALFTPDRAAERQLRAGLVDRAIAALNERGTLHFSPTAEPAIDSADFVVCDDVKRIKTINARMSSARAGIDEVGQWIVITRTDYSVRPPLLIEGRLAQVVESSTDGQTMRVRLMDGSTAAIDRNRHPVRPAFAIGVREARRTPTMSRLAIELTEPKHAWAALVLAASRDPGRATVHVDLAVARDVEELCRVVRGALPAALPVELTPIGELEAVMAPTLQVSDVNLDDWIEDFPEPDAPSVASPPKADRTSVAPSKPSRIDSLIPTNLHPALRAILARANCEPSLLRLTAALAPSNPERHQVADRLLQLCHADSPTRELIGALLQPVGQAQHGDGLAELDLPNALADQAPRAWGPWPLYSCSIDLKTMDLRSSSWQSAFDPIAAPQVEAEMDGNLGPVMP